MTHTEETKYQSKLTEAAERKERLANDNRNAFLRDEIANTIHRMENSRGLTGDGVFEIPVRRKGTHSVTIKYDWKVNIPEMVKIYYLIVPVTDIVKSIRTMAAEKALGTENYMNFVILESLKIDLKTRTELANASAQFRAQIHGYILSNIEPMLDGMDDSLFKDGMSKEIGDKVATMIHDEFSKKTIEIKGI